MWVVPTNSSPLKNVLKLVRSPLRRIIDEDVISVSVNLSFCSRN